MSFAELAPAAMLFIPCRGGISHNAAVYYTDEAVCTGAEVLFEALQRSRNGAK